MKGKGGIAPCLLLIDTAVSLCHMDFLQAVRLRVNRCGVHSRICFVQSA